MIRKNSNGFVSILVVVAIIITFCVMGYDYNECKGGGGKYVRGIFWMECIKQ